MASVKETIAAYGVRPKKSWGQNFLIDPNMLANLARACDLNDGDTLIVEAGAGTGALTDYLHAPGRRVIAVERDRDLAPVLRDRFSSESGVEVLEANILDVDLASFASEAGHPIKLVGNLPYQISAPILFWLLEHRRVLHSAHVLLQREVAERLLAQVGESDYSLLSVLFGRVAQLYRAAEVGAQCFYPPPRVGSTFITIEFHSDVADDVPDDLYIKLVKACFHSRRKTISNSLKRQNFLPLSEEGLQRLLAAHPDLQRRRAEELSVAEYVSITHTLIESGD